VFNRIRHWLAPTGSFLLSLIVCLAGCSKQDSSAPSVVKLRLAYRPRALTDVTPVILAETASSGDKLKIELVAVATAQEGFARMHAGEVDGFAGAPLEGALAQMESSSGPFNFRAYAVSVDSKGAGWVAIIASKESGATKLSDLAGKTIASLPTDQANWLLRRILAKVGVAVDTAKIVRYAPTNPIAGLRSGEHSAIFGPEPGNAMALAEGGVVLARGPISTFLYDGQPVPITLSLISDDFIANNPGAYNEFSKLIDNAIALANEHPDRVRAYFRQEKYGGLPDDVVRLLELPDMRRPTPEIADTASTFVADLVTDGLLKSKIDLGRIFVTK
jgi:ABC-type nitrate/sulfonate/bicarbonate transport system substrate-binding protein